MSATIDPGHSVAARLTYTIDTGVKPITGTTDPDGRLRHSTGEFEEREMTIHDGRPGRAAYSISVSWWPGETWDTRSFPARLTRIACSPSWKPEERSW